MSPLKQIVDPPSTYKSEESAPVPAQPDERQALVQRILASSGFQRAVQLRNILTYTTTAAIFRPEEQVREYQIACEVLGRRDDFDPVSDNIVRSQMSHLRRKLDAYFVEEGRHETLKLTFPRGGYVPVFQQVTVPASTLPQDEAGKPRSEKSVLSVSTEPRDGELHRWKLGFAVVSACGLILLCVSTFYIVRSERMRPAAGTPPAKANEFVQFLGHATGGVSVVLPDTSLMLIQNFLQTEISLDDYARPDFLEQQIARLPTADTRKALIELRSKRNTSVGEAIVASELEDALSRRGVIGKTRYARDLHVRDLDEGNNILIGSTRSNPWAGLFAKGLNFRFERRASDHQFAFVNQHPQAGEAAEYVPLERLDGKINSYVDVALVPNLTQSGFVLLINGSDTQANEAAVRFLLRGQLPPELSGILSREHLTYFEVFLRGNHSSAEGEEQFEVAAIRSAAPNK